MDALIRCVASHKDFALFTTCKNLLILGTCWCAATYPGFMAYSNINDTFRDRLSPDQFNVLIREHQVENITFIEGYANNFLLQPHLSIKLKGRSSKVRADDSKLLKKEFLNKLPLEVMVETYN